MTSQTYQADSDHLAPDHDDVVPEDKLIEPAASLVAAEPDVVTAEPDLAEPDSDPMTPVSDLASLAEPNADQTAHEDLTWHPPGVVARASSEPPTSMVYGYPGSVPDAGDGAEEPGMADSGPGSPSLVSVAFTVPESVPESHLAGNTASTVGPWNEIQAMFVDDPRASIERAAGLVDSRVEELIQSVRERQRSMLSAWSAEQAGTEELRVALQHYRTFWKSIEALPAPR